MSFFIPARKAVDARWETVRVGIASLLFLEIVYYLGTNLSNFEKFVILVTIAMGILVVECWERRQWRTWLRLLLCDIRRGKRRRWGRAFQEPFGRGRWFDGRSEEWFHPPRSRRGWLSHRRFERR